MNSKDYIVKRADGLQLGFHEFVLKSTDDTFIGACFCIVLIRSGSGIWRIGKEDAKVEAGDMVLLNNIEYRTFLSGEANADSFWFSPGLMEGIDDKMCAALFYGAGRKYSHVIRGEALQRIYQALKKEMVGDQSIPLLTALTLTFTVLAYRHLGLSSTADGEDCSLYAAVRIGDAVRWIHAHLSEPIGVLQIAEAVGMSREYFSRSFAKYVLLTPGEYLARCRVARFIERYHSDANILDLALDCGFSSVSGFYQTFRRICGTSPKAYFQKKRTE